jgi:hypothetical protein
VLINLQLTLFWIVSSLLCADQPAADALQESVHSVMSKLKVKIFRNFPVYSVLINLQLTLFRRVSTLL